MFTEQLLAARPCAVCFLIDHLGKMYLIIVTPL